MPDTYTPYLNLTLCEVGASRDTWGSKWNANLSSLDTLVFQASPIGMVADFAGPNAPSGWLICDGRAVSRTTYSALFAIIGTYWGVGDGSTTFALPNLNGRAAVGPGTVIDQAGNQLSLSFTQSLGYVWGRILQTHLPNYNLVTDTQGYHGHGMAGAGGHGHTADYQGYHNHGGTQNAGDHAHTGYTDAQGTHTHGYARSDLNTAGGGWSPGTPYNWSQYGTQTDPAGNHSHNIQTYNAGTHAHGLNYDANHTHNVSAIGDHTHSIYGDGNHQHNVSLGGGGSLFEVLGPILVVTKIIYAGKQASTAVVTAADVPVMLEGHDELAAIREELAQLRAILAPPAQQRRLSAPMRGPH